MDIFTTQDQSIFVSFLELLNVRHTKRKSNKYYNEHPHKYNLFGLSKMLSDYGIQNAATKIKDKKNDIFNIEFPFIAHAGGDFVIVNDIQKDKIQYISNGLNITSSVDEFCESWSGIILLAESNSESIEPNYKQNRINQIFWSIFTNAFIVTLFVLIALALFKNNTYLNIGLSLSLAINTIGICISFLLIKKQSNIGSRYADKICSLFKQGDCNDILESEAAKLLGFIGWSEIGLAYFISNTCIVLFYPDQLSYLALINIFALPYSFWSIWYQKFKVKQWCPLCLIIQIILWTIFIVNIYFGYIQIPAFSFLSILNIGCIYFVPLFITGTLIPKLSESNKNEQIIQEINSIKANEDVFLTLLKKQPYYEVNKNTSKIILGNPSANILVTIFTNPHCDPCAQMHVRIENLLQQTNNLCVQYIFSSFNQTLDSSNKFLIKMFFYHSLEKTKEIYLEWFAKGKFEKESFFKKYQVKISDEREVELEFKKHEEWKKQNGLNATPTILVNGYKLPKNYNIDDLRFFSEL